MFQRHFRNKTLDLRWFWKSSIMTVTVWASAHIWINEWMSASVSGHTDTHRHTHTHTLKHYMQGHSTDWHQGVQQYSMGCILSCSYVSMNGSVCVSWPSSLELKVRLTLVNVPMNGFVSQDWCCVRTEGEKWSSEVCVCVCVELHCRLEALLLIQDHRENRPKH